MKFMGVKVYSFPLVKYYWPFFIGFGATYYGIGKVQGLLMDTSEFINDPRHPRFKQGDLEKK
ncbi:hypothetical protein CANARDRAFT_16753 [[Candida] arabinofermentans NRRL YB-2248]|uniref:ATP synthase subunit J, mitochondrial n=1 Tax=[Candida] arabinofermentans NRRL YB-2248 TaxID=983967 RepID=A0A1E4T3L0_9ASCO|nr:hypothetical protein CANARDRAFT_16753 [[Candida] arabinofermentans NRRL YB-2248]